MIGKQTGLLFDPKAQAAASHWRGVPPRRSMPELIHAYGIDRIDFLKIDIEGSEFDIFEERSDWLSRVRRLAMEVHSGFGAPNTIVQTLSDAGFSVGLAYPDLTPTASLGSSSGYVYAYR